MSSSVLLGTRKSILTLFLLVASLIVDAQQPNFGWVSPIATAGFNEARHTDADEFGNCYVAGRFSDTLVLGSIIKIVQPTSSPISNVFIAKYSTNGNAVWVRQLKPIGAAIGSVTVQDVKVDSIGNIWVLGLYDRYGLEVEGSNIPFPAAQPVPQSNISSYIVKYDSQGALQWVKTFTSNKNHFPINLALGENGDVYVGMNVKGYLANDSTKIDLCKINDAGNIIARKQEVLIDPMFSTSRGNGLSSISYDIKNGVLYTAGLLLASQRIAGISLTVPNGQDIFLASYDENINPITARIILSIPPSPNPGGRITASIDRMVPAESNGVIVAINFYGTVVIDGRVYLPSGPATRSNVYYDALIANFSPAGICRWSNRLNIEGLTHDLSVGSNGQIILTGGSSKNFVYGNYRFVVNTLTRPNYYQQNGFIAAMDSSGNRLWLRQAVPENSSGIDAFSSVSDEKIGKIWTCGIIVGTAVFNGTTISYLNSGSFVASLSSIITRLGFMPGAGAVGATVVINGQNFQGTTAVRFNGTIAAFQVNASGDQIVATVPAGATTGAISIESAQGIVTTATAFQVNGALSAVPATTDWLALFPNPARQQVHVRLPSNLGPAQITVLDAVGRSVRTLNMRQSGGELDITGLAPGIYTLRVHTATQSATRRLLVE